MMVQLRWFTKKKLITAEMVIEYSNKHNISPLHAKRELEGDSPSYQLQYRQIIDKTVRAGLGLPGIEYGAPWGQVPPVNQNWEWSEWKDVNYVTEIIE
jgi:hypothetical protein